MSRDVVILDTETTSLKPDYVTGAGVIWELAVQVRPAEGASREHLWRMKPDLAAADPTALGVGHFYERTYEMCGQCTSTSRAYDLIGTDDPHWSAPDALAAEVARLLDGATIIAANPTFDAGFLTAFLNASGHAATWHYRLRDIGSMAYGATMQPSFAESAQMDASTDDFARALGVDPGRFERHSALGDVRLVAAMLDRIEGAP
jgi:hypothetical protein